MSEDLKTVLDILQNCIKNGHEVEELCKSSPDQIQSNSLVKQFTEKIKHETHLLEKMMKKILALSQSTDDYTKWKKDMQEIVDSMESMSSENLDQIMKAVTRSASAKAKRKFEKHEEIIKDFKGDDVSMEFVSGLLQRNEKIKNCLNLAISKLPKVQEKVEPKSKKTLYIMGDDLQKTMATPEIDQNDLIGFVTIHDNSDAFKSSLSFSNQTIARQLINGILQDDSKGIEVVLKYNEPSHEKSQSINLIDFSQSIGTVSAILEINGKAQEEVEVVEINLLDASSSSPPKNLIAQVKDDTTGQIEEVDVQLVPVNSSNEVHGQIVGLLPILDEKSFAQQFEAGNEDLGDMSGGGLLIDSLRSNTTESSQLMNQIISDLSKNIVEVFNHSITEATSKSLNKSNNTTENIFDDEIEFADLTGGRSSRNTSQRANTSGNASRLKWQGSLPHDIDGPALFDEEISFQDLDDSEALETSVHTPPSPSRYVAASPSKRRGNQRDLMNFSTEREQVYTSPRKLRPQSAGQRIDDSSKPERYEELDAILDRPLVNYLNDTYPREPGTQHKSLIEYDTRERRAFNRSARPWRDEPKRNYYAERRDYDDDDFYAMVNRFKENS